MTRTLESFGGNLQGNSTDLLEDDVTHIAYQISKKLFIYVAPILLFVGTLGSALSLLVLCQRSMRHQTTMFYLAVLAVVDVAVLYTGLLRLWLENQMDVYIRLQSSLSCKLHNVCVYVCLDASVWVTVAVSVDRCIFVSLPYRARQWCTMRRARRTVALILIAASLVNCHFLWTYDREVTGSASISGDGQYRCYAVSESESITRFIEKVWPWVDFCKFCLIPFAVMSVTTIIIVKQLVRSNKKMAEHRRMSIVPKIIKKKASIQPLVDDDKSDCDVRDIRKANGPKPDGDEVEEGIIITRQTRRKENNENELFMSEKLETKLSEDLSRTPMEVREEIDDDNVNGRIKDQVCRRVVDVKTHTAETFKHGQEDKAGKQLLSNKIFRLEVSQELSSECSVVELLDNNNAWPSRRLPPLDREDDLHVQDAFEKPTKINSHSSKNVKTVLPKIQRLTQVTPYLPFSCKQIMNNTIENDNYRNECKEEKRSEMSVDSPNLQQQEKKLEQKNNYSSLNVSDDFKVLPASDTENTTCFNYDCVAGVFNVLPGHQYKTQGNGPQCRDTSCQILPPLSRESLFQTAIANSGDDKNCVYSLNVPNTPDVNTITSPAVEERLSTPVEGMLSTSTPNQQFPSSRRDGSNFEADAINTLDTRDKAEYFVRSRPLFLVECSAKDRLKPAGEHTSCRLNLNPDTERPHYFTSDYNNMKCASNIKDSINIPMKTLGIRAPTDVPPSKDSHPEDYKQKKHSLSQTESRHEYKLHSIDAKESENHSELHSVKVKENKTVDAKGVSYPSILQHEGNQTCGFRTDNVSLKHQKPFQTTQNISVIHISDTPENHGLSCSNTELNNANNNNNDNKKSKNKSNNKTNNNNNNNNNLFGNTGIAKRRRRRTISDSSTNKLVTSQTNSFAPSSSTRFSSRGVYVTLATINAVFWLLNAPIMVFVIGFTYWIPGASATQMARLRLGWTVVNLLQYANSAGHIFLYCLTGPRFRQELGRIFTSFIDRVKSHWVFGH